MNNVNISWNDAKAIEVGLDARQNASKYAGRTGCTGYYGWSGEVFDVILGCQTMTPYKGERRNVAWTRHKKELEERLTLEIELYCIQKRIEQAKERERAAQMEHLGQTRREEQETIRAFPPMLRAPALSMS